MVGIAAGVDGDAPTGAGAPAEAPAGVLAGALAGFGLFPPACGAFGVDGGGGGGGNDVSPGNRIGDNVIPASSHSTTRSEK